AGRGCTGLPDDYKSEDRAGGADRVGEVPAYLGTQVERRGGLTGRGRGRPDHVHTVSAAAVALSANDQRDRANLHGVSAADQDAGRAADTGGNRDSAVGDAGDGRDPAAQAARLSDDDRLHAASGSVTGMPDRITRTNFYNLRDTTSRRDAHTR